MKKNYKMNIRVFDGAGGAGNGGNPGGNGGGGFTGGGAAGGGGFSGGAPGGNVGGNPGGFGGGAPGANNGGLTWTPEHIAYLQGMGINLGGGNPGGFQGGQGNPWQQNPGGGQGQQHGAGQPGQVDMNNLPQVDGINWGMYDGLDSKEVGMVNHMLSQGYSPAQAKAWLDSNYEGFDGGASGDGGAAELALRQEIEKLPDEVKANVDGIKAWWDQQPDNFKAAHEAYTMSAPGIQALNEMYLKSFNGGGPAGDGNPYSQGMTIPNGTMTRETVLERIEHANALEGNAKTIELDRIKREALLMCQGADKEWAQVFFM